MNLGFEESRGSIWIKNIKLEKTITPVDLRASANVGFVCGSKDGGDSGWFGAEPGEDASKFNSYSGFLVAIPAVPEDTFALYEPEFGPTCSVCEFPLAW